MAHDYEIFFNFDPIHSSACLEFVILATRLGIVLCEESNASIPILVQLYISRHTHKKKVKVYRKEGDNSGN